MRKALQMRTNRVAFSDESVSSVPAITLGWLATTPTLCPSTRAYPVRMLGANNSPTSWNAPSSKSFTMMSRMSYAALSLSGMKSLSAKSDSVISGSRPGLMTGGSSKLVDGMYCRYSRTHSNACFSSGAM